MNLVVNNRLQSTLYCFSYQTPYLEFRQLFWKILKTILLWFGGKRWGLGPQIWLVPRSWQKNRSVVRRICAWHLSLTRAVQRLCPTSLRKHPFTPIHIPVTRCHFPARCPHHKCLLPLPLAMRSPGLIRPSPLIWTVFDCSLRLWMVGLMRSGCSTRLPECRGMTETLPTFQWAVILIPIRELRCIGLGTREEYFSADEMSHPWLTNQIITNDLKINCARTKILDG